MSAKKQPRRKHVPQRTCVVCREKKDKRGLTRIVSTPDDGVVIDPSGKRNGRGAYLCSQSACWEKALRTNILEQALRTRISPVERETLAASRPQTAKETSS